MISVPKIPSGTNVKGVGIDSIEVSRIRDSIEKHGDHFLNKIFTPCEQAYCQDKSDSAPFYATRFASKEAVAKAFRMGIGKEFGWLDSKIVHGKHGEPFVELSEDGMKLMKSFGGNKILVSLTHLSTIASAIIIITD